MSNVTFPSNTTVGSVVAASLATVLDLGTLSGSGLSVTLVSGSVTFSITGSDLAVSGDRTLSAGTISSLTLTIGGTSVFVQSGFNSAPTISAVNALLSAFDSNASATAIAAAMASVFGTEAISALGSNADDVVTGSAYADTLVGGLGNDTIVGGAGNDSLVGSGGTDTVDYKVATSGIVVDLSAGTASDGQGGTDTLVTVENVYGSAYDDQITGSSGNNVLMGRGGSDQIDGGTGQDAVDYGEDTAGVLVELETQTAIDGTGAYDLLTSIEDIYGSAHADDLNGDDNANVLRGRGGNDTLDGNAGFDIADYSDSPASVSVNLATASASDGFGGMDLLEDIEGARGSAHDDILIGNGSANLLEGNAGNDTLDGGAGDDTLAGGEGNDTYYVDVATDVVTEDAGGGVDTIIAGFTTSLANYANVDNLTLTGSGAINATGNDLANVLIGNSGANILIGGLGADTIDGGAGIDTVSYAGSSAGVSVSLLGSAGNGGEAEGDVISNVENVIGSAFDDTIAASSAANVLDGGAGADILSYAGATSGVTVSLAVAAAQATGGSGSDTISNFEGLIGSSFNDRLTGTTAANVLDGGAGTDTLTGGAGDDTYYLDVTTDVVVEIAGGGTDTVVAAFTASLASYANVENLTLSGSAAINATGNDLANVINGNSGDNILIGGGGADTIDGGAGIDTVSYAGSSAGVSVSLAGAAGIGGDAAGDVISNVENVVGSGFDDTIVASSSVNVLDGGTGTDTLSYAGADSGVTVSLALTTAQVTGGSGSETISNFENLTGSSFNDGLTGSAIANRLDGGVGVDTLAGAAGDDLYIVDNTGDVVLEDVDGGMDTVQASATYTLAANVESLVLIGSSAINGTGNGLDNTLTGNTGDNSLSGDAGNDTLDGGTGDDTLTGGEGSDRFLTAGGSDVITDFTGNDILDLSNVVGLVGIASVLAAATEVGGSVVINLGDLGTLTLQGVTLDELAAYSDDNFNFRIEPAYTITGTTGNDTINGTTAPAGQSRPAGGDDLIYGLAGNDNISSLEGNDTIDGGAGRDTMAGGSGDDTYSVDNTADLVVEAADSGFDTINSTVTLTLAGNVEALVLAGTAALNGTGNALDNQITGNSAANSLVGAAGSDTLFGLGGNDTLVGGLGADSMDGGEGIDTVSYAAATAGISVSLFTGYGYIGEAEGDTLLNIENAVGSGFADTIEGNGGNNVLVGGSGVDMVSYANAAAGVTVNLALATAQATGGAGTDTLTAFEGIIGSGYADKLTGGSTADRLEGGEGNDTLDGGVGNDTLVGGADDDTYVVNVATDVVVEVADDGTDTVIAAFTASLASYANVENLGLSGSAAINATGNDLANILTGNSGANILIGGAGADTIDGGTGLDTASYAASAAGVFVSLLGDTGVGGDAEGDVIANVENVIGSSLDDTIVASSAANVLNGGAGIDTLSYAGTGAGVTVSLALTTAQATGGSGSDTISNFEHLVGSGFNDKLTGSTLANSISGGAGHDTLDGGTGADTLLGGAGNDLYILDNVGDVVVEDEVDGTDTVQTSATYILGDNIENLILTGTLAINGTGNDLDNAITGNSGANSLVGGEGNDTLDGGVGNDTLVGGADDDTYVVNVATDVVVEVADDGTDTVIAAFTASLASYANVENLGLSGSAAINATGNDFANILTGNSGANILIGGAGADTIDGGTGLDTASYAASAAGVFVSLLGDTGVGGDAEGDVIANVENVIGSSLDDTIVASSAANVLNGGAGIDTLSYAGTGAGMTVSLALTTAQATGGSGSDTISNFEHLVGSGFNDKLTGSTLANSISGGAGHDTLDGGTGADTLLGGAGNDLYILDNVGDVVVEDEDDGTDTVQTSATYILGDNIENLILTGTLAINGIGNDLDNAITGNSGANSLVGGEGNDTLDGGVGNDTLVGGADDDTYVVNVATDVVVEVADDGTDTVIAAFTASLASYANVENLGLSGSAAINATGNDLANILTGNSGANSLLGNGGGDTLDGGQGNDTLDGGTGDDSMIGGAGNDIYVVDSYGDVVVELLNGGTDTVRTTLDYVLGADIENLVLLGSANLQATGNGLANAITGNSGDNVIDGGAGKDTMAGGLGNDTYIVDTLGEVITEAANAGYDTVYSSVTFTLATNAEDLVLTGVGNINGTGSTGNNVITGNAGNNVLDGGKGTDTVSYANSETGVTVSLALTTAQNTGGAGTDTLKAFENLTGSGQADVLTGSTAANVITGGQGADTLRGNGGNDTFDYNGVVDSTTEAYDTILDFNAGDKIDLTDVIEGTFSFLYTSSFTNAANQLRVENVDGGVMVQADINGDGTADMGIFLAGITTTTLNAAGTDFKL